MQKLTIQMYKLPSGADFGFARKGDKMSILYVENKKDEKEIVMSCDDFENVKEIFGYTNYIHTKANNCSIE